MAKGKRAAALFEVIQAAKQKEQLRTKGGGFLTPKWWFKNKDKSNGAAGKRFRLLLVFLRRVSRRLGLRGWVTRWSVV